MSAVLCKHAGCPWIEPLWKFTSLEDLGSRNGFFTLGKRNTKKKKKKKKKKEEKKVEKNSVINRPKRILSISFLCGCRESTRFVCIENITSLCLVSSRVEVLSCFGFLLILDVQVNKLTFNILDHSGQCILNISLFFLYFFLTSLLLYVE